ncbi:MAG: UDP-3-O-[3-hydroxymyristoyl] N-acetylglucosamine deacetylase [Candidatus Pelagibacter sp.]|jgi:UDP-3-O-[3-hydroxymyristoyl] N-acetylglucosamine deacetylase|nr:UDP-3-O-[3-hydroxymyristoyl] N-acetylglucosamine deacetylase [Candidatus Pelagibacter sp.]MDA8570230.1 UDP-3-O-acyl-N-acetylglucosamine deacetylase [Candidatus Pelagibacter bacterium]MDB2500314.1 UDP-3-O-acyl-N-acetylglucosamine deacetylase [Candidatus Pelagibacter bacterium]MDC0364269.1 UDP-3-O-acyl-N-acetylglucosamine deacetylase [Candidatus Pelagibacter sp.]|tara:strand:- start:1032 stop:1952 length:921 start_codon:yes stop_codon:yes gene_type:complete
MSVLSQKTLNKDISLSGVGLHSGLAANIKIKPAEPNTGIVFKRVDIKQNNIVIPNVFNVSSAIFCTTISNEHGVSVSTIEHLMGAFYGAGIDNALVEINNQEVPILDGSAKIFIDEILKVGIKSSESPIKIIKIEKKIEFKDGKKVIFIEPSKISLDIDFELKYENKTIGNQRNSIKVYESDLTDIYNSRTFCLYEDVAKLKEMGLAKGGSLENAIVVKDDKVINENGLRNDKEFVNHKILDCMGDLYLAGYKIIGKLVCSQGGHKLTNQLLRKVFENKENYSILEIKEKTLPYTFVNKKHLRSIA